jgi:hypothetical protein
MLFSWLTEPTEALEINRYIHLNPVRTAALGGHETRDVAAHEITAQLARRDWKAQVKYTVLLGSAEFVAQMRKLLRGDGDQQTGVRRGALEALTRSMGFRLTLRLALNMLPNNLITRS